MRNGDDCFFYMYSWDNLISGVKYRQNHFEIYERLKGRGKIVRI